MAGLAWTLRRLRAMSAREIAHRIGERLQRETGRFQSRGWAPFVCGDGPAPCLPIGENAAAAAPEALLSQAHDVVQRARARRFHHLGLDWPAATPSSPWSFDPLTEQCWPQTPYCFDIPYRRSMEFGDVKYVWEVNRVQHAQAAALLAARGDAAARAFAWSEWMDWAQANPPFRGVNWPSGIELALRIVGLLTTAAFAGGPESPADRIRLRAMLAAHAAWLERFPSRHSSANNHLIAEAAGLFLLGGAFRDHPQAALWEAHGRTILEVEIERQFHADGVGAEQSPTYTAFTLEFYTLCAVAARRWGRALSPAVDQGLARAGLHLRWIMDEAAAPPRIGDDDEGRVIASGFGREADYPASVLAMIASYLEGPDLSPPRFTPQLRNLIVGTPPLPASLQDGARCFADGGYTVIRRKIRSRRTLIVFDHGPLGFGSIAAHGHADALSLWLHLDDRAVLVDAGTWRYHGGGAVRDALRGTAAHNTVSVGGRDQSRIGGAFLWMERAACRILSPLYAEDGEVRITAQHDGYLKPLGLIHQRCLFLDADGLLTVEDQLIGPPQEAFAHWLISPEHRAEAINGGVRIVSSSGGVDLFLFSEAEMEVATAAFSSAFGVLGETQQVRIKVPSNGRLRTQFVIAPDQEQV